MKKLCILGSTGSIGQSTLDVVLRHPDKFNIIALTANTNVELVFNQCLLANPEVVVMADKLSAQLLAKKLKEAGKPNIDVLAGDKALCSIAADVHTDTVMAAIVGASGLMPTLAAVKAGKRVLLANKEALVTSGKIFMDAVLESEAELLPIDSEHNAIFQCLPSNEQQLIGHCHLGQSGIAKILLTGSGGPFRQTSLSAFDAITPEQACAHPNWSMGQKISVDSATMMNKGLEFIEAKWLFNVTPEQIQVVIHPQSIIHSMVQYNDGSVLAQMGNPDMRTPIAHALAYPERIESGVAPLDFFTIVNFEFEQPDFGRYPNLKLAIDACHSGQAACTALNAANEVAVAAFLNRQIKFTQIQQINETSVEKFVSEKVQTISDVITLDERVRIFAAQHIANLRV